MNGSENKTTSEKQRLIDRLCHDPNKRLRKFQVFRGDGQCTEDELCAEINRALDAEARGDCTVETVIND